MNQTVQEFNRMFAPCEAAMMTLPSESKSMELSLSVTFAPVAAKNVDFSL